MNVDAMTPRAARALLMASLKSGASTSRAVMMMASPETPMVSVEFMRKVADEME